MTADLKADIAGIDYSCVDSILESHSVGEVKTAVAAFISAADGMSEPHNGMLVYILCQEFEKRFREWARQYSVPAKGCAANVVIVPPEHAPVMLLAYCVPFGGAPVNVLDGLKRFMERCDEFTKPVCEAITVPEIKRVLTFTQKTYRLLNVVAPDKPLAILRFGNSHTVYNSQCAILGANKQTVIFSFHPGNVTVHDRVYIFAHELGHALHLSLTGDIDVLPEGFDEFNAMFSPRLETLKDKQEAFVDAAAITILNAKGLETHFPTQFSKDMSPAFAGYIRGLCETALRKAGAYAELLPPPNLQRKPVLRPPR